MEEKSRKFLSETLRVKCLYCGSEIMNKNYKQHLKNVHPNQDSSDLRIHGQRSLSDMFKRKPKDFADPVTLDVVINQDKSGAEGIETNIDDDTVTNTFVLSGDNICRKRRLESGESVDSGMGDAELECIGATGSKQARSESITLDLLNKKIDKVLEGVEDLKKGKVAPTTLEENPDVIKNVEHEDNNNSLKFCRSMREILKAGFTFDEKESSVHCSICVGESGDSSFFYDAGHGLEFTSEEFLPKEFCNLKMKLIRHIVSSKSHANLVKAIEEKEKAEKELKSKNKKAGLNLGRACMKNYILGRPYTDYESDVFLLKASGAEVGEMNHSRKFPAALRPYVTEVVHGRVVNYLTSPLEQTGHLPPVGLAADKGTYKHRSRQFLSFVTVMPGGNNLLEVCTSGQPVVTQGSTGAELAKNMKQGFDNFGITSEQIESAVFDGVYFHCSIEDHMNQLYKLKPGQVLFTWDPLHKTGLVDKDMTKQDSFMWLQDLIATCQQIFNTFNWGANYEKFREATAVWKLSLSNLVNFSETRFANSKRKVFKNIHHEFAPIISCLEDQVKDAERNMSALEAANSRVRDKGAKAKELLGRILNTDFLLSLSGLTDIYENFGAIVQITQMVHLLPHERLDLYNTAVQRLTDMGHCQDHQDCARYAKESDKKNVFGLSTMKIRKL